MKKTTLCRWGIYLLGCCLLALGITLNTKTDLGVSPLVSLSWCVSVLTGLTFSAMTFCLYSLFCLLQFPVKGKGRQWRDLLQIPFSLVFSALIGRFGTLLPDFTTVFGKALGLIGALVCTGAGITLMVSMRLIANPADSLVAALAERTGKGMGLVKNLMDLTCVLLTCALGLIFGGRIIGVGIGTLCTVLGVGRVVALTNYLLKDKIMAAAGLSAPAPAEERS